MYIKLISSYKLIQSQRFNIKTSNSVKSKLHLRTSYTRLPSSDPIPEKNIVHYKNSGESKLKSSSAGMAIGAGVKCCKVLALLVILVFSFVGDLSALSVTVNDVECVQEYVLYEGDTISGNFVVVDHDIFWNSDHPGIDFTV